MTMKQLMTVTSLVNTVRSKLINAEMILIDNDDKPMVFQNDSGASVNLIGKSLVQEENLRISAKKTGDVEWLRNESYRRVSN